MLQQSSHSTSLIFAERPGFTAPSTGKAHEFNLARLAIRGPHDRIQIPNGFRREFDAKLFHQFASERRLSRFLWFNLPTGEIPVLVLTNPNQQQFVFSSINQTGASQWRHNRMMSCESKRPSSCQNAKIRRDSVSRSNFRKNRNSAHAKNFRAGSFAVSLGATIWPNTKRSAN